MMIDRFEANIAVMDDGTLIDRAFLPDCAAEGDVIVRQQNGFCIDAEATANRRAQMRAKLSGVLKRSQ